MVYYAILNKDQVCSGIIGTENVINDPALIQVPSNEYDFYLGRMYKSGNWTEKQTYPERQSEFDYMKERLMKTEVQNLELKQAIADLTMTIAAIVGT